MPPSPPPPVPPNYRSVMAFGAVGDGKADDTAAMTSAFNAACSLAAAGTAAVMLVPAGLVFRLAAPVTWAGPCGTTAAATLTVQVRAGGERKEGGHRQAVCSLVFKQPFCWSHGGKVI